LQIQNYFPEEKKGEIIECLISLMGKLQSLKYHSDKYSVLEDQLYLESVKRFQEQPSSTKEAIELISEIEAFLMQLKSCLDILVKILIPTIGKDYIKSKTFANKGEDIIKGLKKYKTKKNVHEKAVDALIDLIQEDKDRWLTQIINLRDTFAHYTSLRNYYFIPIKTEDGNMSAIRPSFNGIDTKILLSNLFQNTLDFCQDFLSIALVIPLPAILRLVPSSPAQMEESFGEHGKFIKYSLS
jgi:hypothetical protein